MVDKQQIKVGDLVAVTPSNKAETKSEIIYYEGLKRFWTESVYPARGFKDHWIQFGKVMLVVQSPFQWSEKFPSRKDIRLFHPEFGIVRGDLYDVELVIHNNPL